MTYDIHAHCVPADLLERLRSDPARHQATIEEADAGAVVVEMAGFRTLAIGDDLVSLERRLATMDQQRVEVQVLSAFIDLVGYETSPEVGTEWSRLYNEALAREAGRQPHRLKSLATVPIQDGTMAAQELEHAVVGLGMVGAQIGTHVGDRQLDDPDLEPFWAKASELGCIVLLHPRDPLGPMLVDDYMLRHLVGRPADTTLAAARLILSGVLERHPGAKVVVVHGGGFLPYQIGRLAKGFSRPSAITGIVATVDPRDALRHFYYDTILNQPVALRALIEMVGAERVLVGTDYPYGLGDTDPLRSLDDAGLSPDVRRLLERENFETIEAGLHRRALEQ